MKFLESNQDLGTHNWKRVGLVFKLYKKVENINKYFFSIEYY